MRSSPVLHDVKGHTRNGKHVNPYKRGSGQRTRSRRHRPVFDEHTDMGVHAWTVNYTYDHPSVKGETVLVFADSYDGVLDEAFDERKHRYLAPTAVELIDPSIGEVLNAVKTKGRKVAGLGARYSITAVKAVGGAAKQATKEGMRMAKYKVTTRLLEQLLKDAYGPRGPRRLAARINLKRQYPDIWDMTNLSVDR